MMALLLGHLSDPDREIQRTAEVVEPVFFFEMMLLDDPPATIQLLLIGDQLVSGQRGHPAPGTARTALMPARSFWFSVARRARLHSIRPGHITSL